GVGAVARGGVVMLENVRFNAGEASKDDGLRGESADQLASLADLCGADGFGAVPRQHASVCDVAARLPHAAGYLVRAETAALERLTGDIQRPYVVVLGGAKVADKLPVVGGLLGQADQILIGGGRGFTFPPAPGPGVGLALTAGGLGT